MNSDLDEISFFDVILAFALIITIVVGGLFTFITYDIYLTMVFELTIFTIIFFPFERVFK